MAESSRGGPTRADLEAAVTLAGLALPDDELSSLCADLERVLGWAEGLAAAEADGGMGDAGPGARRAEDPGAQVFPERVPLAGPGARSPDPIVGGLAALVPDLREGLICVPSPPALAPDREGSAPGAGEPGDAHGRSGGSTGRGAAEPGEGSESEGAGAP